jgi:hypothetical protein
MLRSPRTRMTERFKRFGPAGSLCCSSMSQPGVIVPIGIAVAAYFTPDNRAVTPDPLTDLGITGASVKATHDLDAFIETQPMTPPPDRARSPGSAKPVAFPPRSFIASVAPPLPTGLTRHAEMALRLPQPHPRTDQIEKLPPHLSRPPISTRHGNPQTHGCCTDRMNPPRAISHWRYVRGEPTPASCC